ncbi:MAG: UDP-2,3-diacylglucosamine diphosphatase [Phycisphaerae bacterium]|nr:UDP-2,3-diacylglucosamine diphosphatase [Gemmatimonadaceae bacterium]
MTNAALPAYLPTPCLLVGDAHLGVATPESERALISWFRHAPTVAKSVVIMGDLFDFWFAWKHAMPRRGYRVLAAIADLADAGVPVVWIGGNHDCWRGDALERETGARYTLNPWHGSIGSWRAELAHGDGLRDIEDASYRRLRTVLRNPLAIRAFGWLHPDWSSALAMSSSKKSRHMRALDGGNALLQVATKRLSEPNGPDLIVHGHTHVPRLERAGYGTYGNAGAWYIDQQYLRIDEEHISRLSWKETGDSEVLGTVNRVNKERIAPVEKLLGKV